VFEEFFSLRGTAMRYLSTAASLALPAVVVFLEFKDASGQAIPAWKAIWPVFGATNQLLAALALLVITVWLAKAGKNFWISALPLAFMAVMTLWALAQLVVGYGLSLIGGIAVFLLLLALVLFIDSARRLCRLSQEKSGAV